MHDVIILDVCKTLGCVVSKICWHHELHVQVCTELWNVVLIQVFAFEHLHALFQAMLIWRLCVHRTGRCRTLQVGQHNTDQGEVWRMEIHWACEAANDAANFPIP